MNNHKFSANQRLKTPKQFQAVFDKNRKIYGRFWILFYAESQKPPSPKLGLAISKKVSPLAVQRNRLKRIVREFFRTHQDEINNVDIVVLAKKSALKCCKNNSQKLFSDLNYLTKKLHKETTNNSH